MRMFALLLGLKRIVIPAKAGIYRQYEAWIPAFAGMTIRQTERSRAVRAPLD
jgi:hypothetical protein